ncbi:MAG: hypothetical protein WAZ18_06255 [Alphaproteobacteria bacterium]
MNTLATEVMIWLNDEPRHGPYMQRDGRFALLSWRDMVANRQRPLFDIRMMGWLSIVVVGLPVLFII